MNRWERTRRHVGAVLLATATFSAAGAAWAQGIQRPFPPNAFRGDLTLTRPPEVMLNGEAVRLAPGTRMRDAENRLVFPNQLQGQSFTVNYTRDVMGQVLDVWLLSAAEAQQPGKAEKPPAPTTINLGPLGRITFGQEAPPASVPYDQLPRFPKKY